MTKQVVSICPITGKLSGLVLKESNTISLNRKQGSMTKRYSIIHHNGDVPDLNIIHPEHTVIEVLLGYGKGLLTDSVYKTVVGSDAPCESIIEKGVLVFKNYDFAIQVEQKFYNECLIKGFNSVAEL